MAEHTKGPWREIVCAIDGLNPLTTKTEYLAFCEQCWVLTQKHGDVQEMFYGVDGIAEEGDGVIIALCGNGPHGKANARLIAAAPATKEQRDALLDACKAALPLIAGTRIKYDNFPPEDNLDEALDRLTRSCEQQLEAAIAAAEKE